LYETRGEYRKALEYYKQYHKSDKEIFNVKSSERITEMQTRYDTLKKEKENEILRNENKIQELRLSRATFSRNAFIIGFFLVSVILTLIFKKYLYLFAFWKKEKYIGQFRLMDQIGSGAMSTIYKAHSIVDKSKIAAVKILRGELFSNENSRQRFNREAVIIDKLEHPHIIQIFARGEAGQKPFIAMEFLKGRTLASKIMAEGKLNLKESLHIMARAADALAFIHSKNIIHRDLKPANIMLIERDGDSNFVKLLDFGLAKMEFQTKLTQSGNFVGTIEYVSPEQLLDADSSPANDIFSLGVTFYKMLSGQSPFPGETVIDIMRKVIKEEPLQVTTFRTDIPGELDNLIMKMLSKKPGQRPTAESVLGTLKSL
jgi:serine/threonine-protein kinase